MAIVQRSDTGIDWLGSMNAGIFPLDTFSFGHGLQYEFSAIGKENAEGPRMRP